MSNKCRLFSILGDSISTFEGCSEPKDAAFYDSGHKIASGILTPSDTWWGLVIEHFGGKLLVNNSFSGSTVCYDPQYLIESYACSDERTSSLGKNGELPDVIIVYMGTNDWGRGIRIYKGEGVNVDNHATLFAPAYKLMLEKLKRNYPDAEIWCVTLGVSRWSAEKSFSFPYYYGGRHISEYCDAIISCAEECGCNTVDLYHDCEAYDTLDGMHPNSSGMKTIAECVIKGMS